MAKVSYANLKLKVNSDITTFNFNGTEIELLNYLPMEDKYDIIMIALQKAQEDDIINPLKLDMYFHLNLVYLYTNLSFTEKQKENEEKIYDVLKSNGFIDEMLKYFDESEYATLITYLEELQDIKLHYQTTAASVVNNLINNLPQNAQAAAEIMNTFDPNKFAEVVNFAQAANGGRPI